MVYHTYKEKLEGKRGMYHLQSTCLVRRQTGQYRVVVIKEGGLRSDGHKLKSESQAMSEKALASASTLRSSRTLKWSRYSRPMLVAGSRHLACLTVK